MMQEQIKELGCKMKESQTCGLCGFILIASAIVTTSLPKTFFGGALGLIMLIMGSIMFSRGE